MLFRSRFRTCLSLARKKQKRNPSLSAGAARVMLELKSSQNLLKKSKKKSPNTSKPKVVVILGPTSSGKSELGVQLALTFKGEIVSADSRQVYKGLDVSSSKVTGRWERMGRRRFFVYKGITHHLIDFVPPRKQFTVAQYKKRAERAIRGILNRGKLPIIVGGTGFYIDALVHNMNLPKVAPQKKLRKELESLTTDQLVTRLSGLDPNRADNIDLKNRRRLIRAIEIVVLTKSQIPALEPKNEQTSPYKLLKLGVRIPKEELKRRISSVVEKRVEGGVVNEIKSLHKRGVGWKRLDSFGLEYKYISQYIRGEIDLETMKESMKKEYWRYAKRQITWFKRDESIIWVDSPEKAFSIIQDFLSPEA